MTDSQWWIGVLLGTAAWLLLVTYTDDVFLPALLALHPIVAASTYMDAKALERDDEPWQPSPVIYAAPALLFPAVVGPLYLFLRLVRVEMQDDEDQEGKTAGEGEEDLERETETREETESGS